jgi:hypothetical protein
MNLATRSADKLEVIKYKPSQNSQTLCDILPKKAKNENNSSFLFYFSSPNFIRTKY